MKKKYLVLIVLVFLLGLPGVSFGQTEDEVGDVASFGKEAKFFGYALTGAVFIRRGCYAPYIPTLGPNDRCFAFNPTTNIVNFDAKDIGRIQFPEKTFQNIIYLLTRHQYSYRFINSTTLNKFGQFQYTPYVTIESAALNDPALINPQTGQPFNGKVDLPLAGGKSMGKTIFPNYQEYDSVTYSSTSTGGFTKKYFMTNFGLSQAVVDDLFYQKMTIQLNIMGATGNAEQANYSYGVRFLGN
jgi:hypothetical protein